MAKKVGMKPIQENLNNSQVAPLNNENFAGRDEEILSCQTSDSLHEIALRMAKFSSPPGSKSYYKTLRILKSSTAFQINIRHPIFTNVVQNLGLMLQGFGLQSVEEIDHIDRNSTVRVQISFLGLKKYKACEKNPNNTSCLVEAAAPKIIIQTEQLQAQGFHYRKYLKACHESPLCAIWDYSDSHLSWARREGISDSFMLLPVMHQSRLGRDISLQPPRRFSNRSLDLAFFGLMTDRRMSLRQAGIKRNWSMRFETNHNITIVKDSYNDARVCLIVHTYPRGRAAEFHRLVELVTSGCVPVMEAVSDKLSMATYERCGGLVLAPYKQLVSTVEEILNQIKNGVRQHNEAQVEWWRQGINWETLLRSIYADEI